MVLLLSPPLVPSAGAIESLVEVLQSHPEVGAVCGKWRNSRAVVEKGYNVRAFPTLRALAYDLLFLNKLLPGNACTRRYKMHDFDHRTARSVEHGLDFAFLARTELLIGLGGFDERYRFGWFEQVEMCQSIIRGGHQVVFEPTAEFSSPDRAPVIDRLLADHYAEFYFDQERYAARWFGVRGAAVLRILLAAGMIVRLAFALALPGALRRKLLVRYRSYVADGYVRSMTRAYWQTLRQALSTRLEAAE
jgi:GT2 family glycosyltransferase